ncbi:MAG: hypothetical protein K2X77_00995, partial [Candidatus Obscuribacterales bacterium]|nr:hypothetical protein [Candidatus Obscuribacterales bacterium]
MAAKADESADESVTQKDSTVNTGESQSAAWVGKAPVIYLAALLVLLAVYYWPCLTGTGDFFISDLSFYFQPFCQFIGRELRAGILPLWNPYLYSGMSQLAVPSPALFYPPSFLLFLLPFSLGLSIYMILHQLIGAVGTYLFLRRVGATIESSCFAALAFSLCAYNFTLIQNFTLPATICWLPLALYFCQGLWTATKSPETDPGSAGILPASDRSDPGSAGILPDSDRSDPGSAGILPDSDRSDPGSAGILPASDRSDPGSAGILPASDRSDPGSAGI